MSTVTQSPIHWYQPTQQVSFDGPTEEFVYVGCVHQVASDLLVRLYRLLDSPPNMVFFGGDFTGSVEFNTLQYHFYRVNNIARGKLKLHDASTAIKTEEILDCPAEPLPGATPTLRDEFRRFYRYRKELEDPISASDMTNALTDRNIARGIMSLCTFADYGTYTRDLPFPLRQKLGDSLEATSTTLLQTIHQLEERGVEVHIVGGNWDNVKNTAKNLALETVFDAEKFFNEQGVLFHTVVDYVETDTTLHVLVPYWEIDSEMSHGTKKRLLDIMQRVNAKRIEGKQIIVVAHGQPAWEPHFPGTECKGYNLKVIQNLARVIEWLRPDEIIYPHQHDPMRNAEGVSLPVNTHYWLQSSDKGSVEILRDNEYDQVVAENRSERILTASNSLTLATYVPLRHTAPLFGDRKLLALGGTRLPAMVQ